MIQSEQTIGLRRFATSLPSRFAAVEDLNTSSPAATLRGFGFSGAWVDGDVAALAKSAAKAALEGMDRSEIDAILWVSALSASHQLPSEHPQPCPTLEKFCYPGSWLQEELGLEGATVSGIAQQGCAGIFSAMRQARALLLAEPELRNVLCVAADALPPESPREALYNVISDAGCACIVSREAVAWKWLGYHQISKGYYWDVPARRSEIIAAYFPTAAAAIRGALSKAKLEPGDIDLVIPTGVNRTSWPILMRLCGIPEERLYEPQRSFGHTVSADSFLYLEEAAHHVAFRPGMKVLLFAYGFGSSWCALVVETYHFLS